MADIQQCSICGCTHDHACVDSQTQAACAWVLPDLCSACAGKPQAKAKLLALQYLTVAIQDFMDLHLADGEASLEQVAAYFFGKGLEIAPEFMGGAYEGQDEALAIVLPGSPEFADEMAAVQSGVVYGH